MGVGESDHNQLLVNFCRCGKWIGVGESEEGERREERGEGREVRGEGEWREERRKGRREGERVREEGRGGLPGCEEYLRVRSTFNVLGATR